MSKKLYTFDDGEWYAATLGHFVSLLIDSGDVAVLYRVTNESGDDENGRYRCTFEIVTLPDGHIVDAINEKGEIGIHKVLAALLAQGVVS